MNWSRQFSSFPWLRRRWYALILPAVTAGVLAFLLSGPPSYESSLEVRVVSGESEEGPGSSFEAQALAGTYARLIGADSATNGRIADQLALDPGEVASSTSAVQLPGTSILQVTFASETIDGAAEGARVTADVLTGQPIAESSVNASALRLVRVNEPVEVGTAPLPQTGAAVVAGLLFGAGLVLLLERADPRLDRVIDAEQLLGQRVVELSESDPSAVAALVAWAEARTSELILVPLHKDARPAALRMVGRMREHIKGTGSPMSISLASGRSEAPVVAVKDVRAATTVLGVVIAGGQRSAVRKSLQTLEAFGRLPSLTVFAIRPARGSAAREVTAQGSPGSARLDRVQTEGSASQGSRLGGDAGAS
jgi:capsular polysaccharide biosynthesis protein